MIADRFGGAHTSDESEAVAAFEQAVACVAAHRTGAVEALDQALARDPLMVSAEALRGFACIVLARAETVQMGRDALARARAALAAKRHATGSEGALVAALAQACDGRFLVAADILDDHAGEHPHDFLALKLAHSLRFMGGDLPGMLAATSRALPWWTSDRPGAGYVFGCHAFALEEGGHLASAERFGERAVALEPGDAWGLHAVSHIHETQLRIDEGIAWLQGSRAHWSRCNNFRFHLAWHLALFYLEQGEDDRVLDLYDAEIRPTPTDDFRDVANAASLLWRLGQHGIAVGERWAELTAIAGRRREETTLVFASLHNLLALVASGDRASAHALAAAIAAGGAEGGEQSRIGREVGAPVARVVLGLEASEGSALIALARDLPRIGGSNAQRDVFLRSLALAAAERGDVAGVASIQSLRPKLRAGDRFARLVAGRLAVAGETRRRVA
jgi:hypothetical protein